MSNNDTLRLDEVTIPGIDDGERDLSASVRYYGPPGTGKTTTAAAHIARLIQETNYTIADICWITYRKTLAMDILRRLADWGVIDESELEDPSQGRTRFINTVHAVANRSVGGLGKTVEYSDKRDFCASVGIQYWNPTPWEDGDGELLFKAFHWLVNNGFDPSDAEQVAIADSNDIEQFQRQCRKSIPKLWQRWQRYKVENEIIDFYEQLERPIKDDVACPCPVLVVDEYHDAYPLMAVLAEQWIETAKISIVCGDPDQVVNSYDGASPTFFNELDLPNQLLDTSYRVPTNIWDGAIPFLRRAPGHEPPDVETESGGSMKYYESPGVYESHSDEASGEVGKWSVPDVAAGHPGVILNTHGVGAGDTNGPGYGSDPDSILILARTRQQVVGITAALDSVGVLYKTQSDIPDWRSSGKTAGFDGVDPVPTRRRVYDALATIRGFDPDIENHLYPGTLSLTSGRGSDGAHTRFDLDPLDAAALLDSTKAKYHSQSRAAEHVGTTTNDIVKELRDRDEDDPVTEEEMCRWVDRSFWETYGRGQRSVGELIKTGGLSGRDMIAIEQALARHAGVGPIDDDEIGIDVMTIHASKGYEAKDVVVHTGITKTIMKSMREDPSEYANEMRTWYVACTRASDRLHLVLGGFTWMTNLPESPLRTLSDTPPGAGGQQA